MSVPAEIITLHEDHQVTEVEVSRIRTRFRLRTPQEEKIEEIAESIRLVGLISPITISSDTTFLLDTIDGKVTLNLDIKPSLQSSGIQPS